LTLPSGTEAEFIQPSKPWQNGYIESFFGKLRDELLSMEVFTRGSELQSSLQDFQEYYNHHRPHLGLKGLTPAKFIEGLKTKAQETLQL
jgi:putative transposase